MVISPWPAVAITLSACAEAPFLSSILERLRRGLDQGRGTDGFHRDRGPSVPEQPPGPAERVIEVKILDRGDVQQLAAGVGGAPALTRTSQPRRRRLPRQARRPTAFARPSARG